MLFAPDQPPEHAERVASVNVLVKFVSNYIEKIKAKHSRNYGNKGQNPR